MKQTNKKAFTIVELVIVIAVVAILAAVLIPTFISLIRKSRISTDTSLVRNLNTALAEDSIAGKHETMTDALRATEDYGYIATKLIAKAKGNEILWDSVNDVFCYLNDGKIEYLPDSVSDGSKLSAGDYRLWKIYTEAPTISDGKVQSEYSIYVANQTVADAIDGKTVDVGLDCGDTTIGALTYANSGAAKNVTIYTNNATTTLTINAAGDVVNHYGIVGGLNIIAVADASYHENGTVAFAEIANGRIVLEKGSAVEQIHLTATDNAFNNIIVAKDVSVEMPDFSRDPVDISAGDKLIVALQGSTESSSAKNYVWLTAIGIYEQVTVSSSSTSAGTTYAAQSGTAEQKETALQIANNITTTIEAETYTVEAEKVGENWTYTLKGKNATTTAAVAGYTVSATTTTVTVEDNGNPVESTSVIGNGLGEDAKAEAKSEVVNKAIENTVFVGVAVSKTGETTQLMTIEAFRDAVNAGNTYAGYTVKLLDDINLGNIEWTPLKLFKGTFDGNNKTLSGLKLNESTDISSGYVDIGFFEKTENATIKNLTIDGFEIYGTGRVSSGTLVGNASNGLTLRNVIVTSTNKLTGKWSGGLMGRTSVTMDGSNKRDCKYIIDNCRSSVGIVGERTGGFVGQMDGCNNSIYNSSNGFATFTSCSFDGNVNANKGTAMAAGFVAQFTGGDRTWFVYTYQNCSVNGATIDSSGSKGDFTAVSQCTFSIFNCRINDENVTLPTQVNFAFCNSATVYAYSINGTIYAIKAANGGYYNVESNTIGVDAQVAGSSNHSISLSDTTNWHKVTNAYTDFYGNYIVSADASAIYRSVPTNLEEGTKLQRRTYVAGHDYSANQDTYGFDMWRIVNNDVEAEGPWQDVGSDGATGFVLGAGIYYYLDPTSFVDLNLYNVSGRETSDHWMIYTVTAK